MAHVELVIKDLGTIHGYRIVTQQNPTQFRPNPKVEKGDTVSWHSPDRDACVAILAESPFTYNGAVVNYEFLKIPKGGTSQTFQISNTVTQGEEYEYAVLVQETDRDYTYVRGANSPPGVIVGP